MSATIYEGPRATAKPGETIITSTCGHNCGGRCVVNANVTGGVDPRTRVIPNAPADAPEGVVPWLCNESVSAIIFNLSYDPCSGDVP
jgi:hypothetical protein